MKLGCSPLVAGRDDERPRPEKDNTMNLPSDSLGVVAYAAGDLRVEPVSLPEPAVDETVVDVAYGGVCGSDLHYWTHGAAGDSILRAPMVLGHEVVGTVVRAAADGSGPTVGTEVAVHPASPAGDGVTRYPADRPNLSPGCTYLGSAALVVAVLKRAGASEITAVDMHDLPLENARKLGATRTLLSTQADEIAAVQADIVVESSGSHRGLASAFRGATLGGRVVMVGLLPSGEQPVLISLAITRELELVGAFRFNDEIDEVIAALADGSLYTDPIVTHEFDVADALQAFAVARDAAISSKVLLRF